MRMAIMISLFLPMLVHAQMMPERLVNRDTIAATQKTGRSANRTAEKTISVADTPVTAMPNAGTPTTINQIPEKETPSPLSSFEFWLSIIILSFTVLVVIIEVWLIRSNLLTAESSLRAILVTIIIGATLFLITAGYSNNQIAPAMGLFGTIAGYLLGRNVSVKE